MHACDRGLREAGYRTHSHPAGPTRPFGPHGCPRTPLIVEPTPAFVPLNPRNEWSIRSRSGLIFSDEHGSDRP